MESIVAALQLIELNRFLMDYPVWWFKSIIFGGAVATKGGRGIVWNILTSYFSFRNAGDTRDTICSGTLFPSPCLQHSLRTCSIMSTFVVLYYWCWASRDYTRALMNRNVIKSSPRLFISTTDHIWAFICRCYCVAHSSLVFSCPLYLSFSVSMMCFSALVILVMNIFNIL